VLADASFWVEGLRRAGLEADRRALRLLPQGLAWERVGDDLLLHFSLTAGAYATVVLRELLETGLTS
jgi:tRNA pseudouridine13 synthase